MGRLADIAVLGSGAVGAAIAEVAARAGHPVRLFDIRPEAATRAVDRLGRSLARDVARGLLEAGEAGATVGRVSVVPSLQGTTREVTH